MNQFKTTRQKVGEEKKEKNQGKPFSSGQVRKASMGSPDKHPLGILSNTPGGDEN